MAPTDHIDERLALLLRAAVRFDLVEAGEMTLDEAFSPDFIGNILTATNCCPCHSAINRNFDRIARELREERLRRWRRSR